MPDATIQLPAIPAAESARRIARTLRDAGHTALLAGGCVRDSLLGRKPKDFDVATSARPDEVEKLFPKTLAVGKSFGVIVVVDGDVQTEVATFRSDGGYADGRHPESIRFSTPEEDASRRDFTVNGLFADPVSGAVLDYVGGLADLAAGVVRAIGDPAERFGEDALRMLRAVRFAGVLDFTLDPATAEAIRRSVPLLRHVSAERVGQELVRSFTESPRAGRALDLLRDTGLLAATLPEVQAMLGCEQPPQFHPEGDVYTHTRLMLDDMPPPAARDPRLAMAVLLHDVGKPPTHVLREMPGGERRHAFPGHASVGAGMAFGILLRLRRPLDFARDVSSMVERHMMIVEAPKMRPARLRRFLASPTMALELELMRLDTLHSVGDFTTWDFVRDQYAAIQAEPRLPPRWVRGDDLLAMGMAPGPEMGAFLDEVFDRQLEGAAASRDDLLAWVRANFPRKTEACRNTALPEKPTDFERRR